MFAAEEEKADREEAGIAGKADPSGCGRSAGMGETIDAVVDPIFRDVAVDIGIAGDVGKLEEEDEAKSDGEKRAEEEKPFRVAEESEHVSNIFARRSKSKPDSPGPPVRSWEKGDAAIWLMTGLREWRQRKNLI